MSEKEGFGFLYVALCFLFLTMFAVPACGDDHVENTDSGIQDRDAGDGGTEKDGGVEDVTFFDIAPPGGFVSSFAFHPTEPNTLWAGMDDSGGLFVSYDGGKTWVLVEWEYQNWSAWDISVNPQDPDDIVIVDAYGHGVLQSKDGGSHWQERNIGLETNELYRRVHGIARSKTVPETLFIGTEGGVFRSTDNTASWQLLSTGLPQDLGAFRLAVDSTDASVVFAGLDGGSVYRSLDGGQTWELVFDLLPNAQTAEFWDLVISSKNPDWVLAGASDKAALSRDGGETWTFVASSFLENTAGFPIGVSTAFSPDDETVFYLGTFRINGPGIRLRTNDGGQSFVVLTPPLDHESVLRLRVNSHDSSRVIVGLVGDGIEIRMLKQVCIVQKMVETAGFVSARTVGLRRQVWWHLSVLLFIPPQPTPS